MLNQEDMPRATLIPKLRASPDPVSVSERDLAA